MRVFRSSVVVLAALLFCLSGCGRSRDDNRSDFSLIDANEDGKITVEEFVSHVFETTFSDMDYNDDGKITRKEWLATSPASRFQERDADNNDAVTFDEWSTPDYREAIHTLFEGLDDNGDGVLEETEVAGMKAVAE